MTGHFTPEMCHNNVSHVAWVLALLRIPSGLQTQKPVSPGYSGRRLATIKLRWFYKTVVNLSFNFNSKATNKRPRCHGAWPPDPFLCLVVVWNVRRMSLTPSVTRVISLRLRQYLGFRPNLKCSSTPAYFLSLTINGTATTKVSSHLLEL